MTHSVRVISLNIEVVEDGGYVRIKIEDWEALQAELARIGKLSVPPKEKKPKPAPKPTTVEGFVIDRHPLPTQSHYQGVKRPVAYDRRFEKALKALSLEEQRQVAKAVRNFANNESMTSLQPKLLMERNWPSQYKTTGKVYQVWASQKRRVVICVEKDLLRFVDTWNASARRHGIEA